MTKARVRGKPSYAETIAVDLARVVGAQPGSILYHGIVGALKEVVEHCAEEAESFKVTPDTPMTAAFAGRAIGNLLRKLA